MPVSSDKTAFVITRSLPLPRAVMWKAWSESDQLEHQRTLALYWTRSHELGAPPTGDHFKSRVPFPRRTPYSGEGRVTFPLRQDLGSALRC